MSRREKLITALLVVAIGAFLFRPARHMLAVAALRDAIAPHGKITVGFRKNPFADQAKIDRLLAFSGDRETPNTSRPMFEYLVGSPVNSVELYDLQPATGELANMLLRFRGLAAFSMWETSGGPYARDPEWKAICEAAATMHTLDLLNLRGREITDASIAPLAGHPSLQTVILNTNRLTPACFSTLSTLPHLHTLTFKHITAPTEGDWVQYCAGMRKLPKLFSLTLAGDNLTDAALANLAGHPVLNDITIYDNRLTSESARTFRAIPKLTHLSFGSRNPPFTESERKALMDALPAVRFDFDLGMTERFK